MTPLVSIANQLPRVDVTCVIKPRVIPGNMQCLKLPHLIQAANAQKELTIILRLSLARYVTTYAGLVKIQLPINAQVALIKVTNSSVHNVLKLVPQDT